MLVALPTIAIAVAPTSSAQDDPDSGPCAWDVASMACLEYQQGGAEAVCAWGVSMACNEAQQAAQSPPPAPDPAPPPAAPPAP